MGQPPREQGGDQRHQGQGEQVLGLLSCPKDNVGSPVLAFDLLGTPSAAEAYHQVFPRLRVFLR